MKDQILSIQSAYKGFKIRSKIIKFKLMPIEIQHKIIYFIREQFYINKENKIIKNIITRRIEKYFLNIYDKEYHQTYFYLCYDSVNVNVFDSMILATYFLTNYTINNIIHEKYNSDFSYDNLMILKFNDFLELNNIIYLLNKYCILFNPNQESNIYFKHLEMFIYCFDQLIHEEYQSEFKDNYILKDVKEKYDNLVTYILNTITPPPPSPPPSPSPPQSPTLADN